MKTQRGALSYTLKDKFFTVAGRLFFFIKGLVNLSALCYDK